MVPERFEDLLDAFDRGEGDEEELALAIREQVIGDLAGAKRLLAEGKPARAQQTLDEALRTARELVADRIGPPQPAAAIGEQAIGTSSQAGSSPSAYRVVIADGNRTRRSLHRTLLEEAGPFDVVAEADEGRRLLDAVRAKAPDVVLLDLEIPEQDSLALIAELERTASEVHLAVLPAFADEAFAARAREAGADLYLDEDVGGAALVDRLRELAAAGP